MKVFFSLPLFFVSCKILLSWLAHSFLRKNSKATQTVFNIHTQFLINYLMENKAPRMTLISVDPRSCFVIHRLGLSNIFFCVFAFALFVETKKNLVSDTRRHRKKSLVHSTTSILSCFLQRRRKNTPNLN